MGVKNELKFFKKQEIAEVDPVTGQDHINLQITYIDNGDNRAMVRFGDGKRSSMM
jgi:hypothetical protein